jgi:DNA-binding NtrC family response regulator
MENEIRILIVDDEVGMCDFLSYYLNNHGFEVQTALNGDQAINCFEKGSFQLVLADIMMPTLDGLEMLRRIKALDPNVVVIMMTAYASLDKAMKAIKYGAADLLVKPFETHTLLATIQRSIGKSNPSPGSIPSADASGA